MTKLTCVSILDTAEAVESKTIRFVVDIKSPMLDSLEDFPTKEALEKNLSDRLCGVSEKLTLISYDVSIR